MSEEIKENICKETEHNFIPISWRNSLLAKAAERLACTKCGKIIPTNIEWAYD